MSMIHNTPMRDALAAAGEDMDGILTYQDYIHIIINNYPSETPMTEQQFEIFCSVLGNNRPMYPSTIKQMIANREATRG